MIRVDLCPQCGGRGELCSCGAAGRHRRKRRTCTGPAVRCPRCDGAGILKRKEPASEFTTHTNSHRRAAR